MSILQARNEAIIHAPASRIWAIITDISVLHKVNPGVIHASGRMDRLGDVRTCQIDNNGRKGTMTEKLIEFIPEKKTVWTIESDTMGMRNMLKNTQFVFNLEKLEDNKTKVINETYYQPANLMAKIMNGLMMKKMISKAQEQILLNIKSLTEN
ncbi:MAG: SRPBCC family protein [Saprospiraceae bacterium]|nr:SRPBCC family protein [Saprospiraceae bacterium]HMW38492.1 SRPBCC family protein [Saprospiraceae bacterium]HMX88373.1 SRPBCC family protein [Saprospiraceae bacterium]HMZ40265.1 SRPBCC family protein [Saprospiraceae bacterium]HNA65555.1 SRPBCC family protein [Saprospiraceae bacterium]